MKVMEIFDSIQGEGAFMGVPATFVRFPGCNLSCPFCDTKESWTASDNMGDWTPEGLATELCSFMRRTSIVVLTGGEPCLQKDLPELIDRLALKKRFVCIETNGTQEVPQGVNWVACSPKPQSDYSIHHLCKPNELKYVVTEDFEADTAIPDSIRKLYAGHIWLQPDGSDPQTMELMWKKAYDLAMRDSRLRVGVQLHKLMEVE